jgi:FkbH-like protein
MNSKEIKLHIAVISNISFEPYGLPLIKQYFGENTIVSNIPFGEYSENMYQENFKNINLLVVWLNLDTIVPNNSIKIEKRHFEEIIALCQNLQTYLISMCSAKILWFSFENYHTQQSIAIGHTYYNFVDMLNLTVSKKLSKDRVTFIDLKHIIAEVGVHNAYDSKGKYRWNAPYSKNLIEVAVKEIHKQYLIEKGYSKKCLVLDCDNVLWGGILSEDGIENLKLASSGLGRLYHDFQRFVLYLYYHGVILAVCSKNDLEDVLMVFREHSEMLLRPEHIACFQVNWEDKPNNIKKISEKLNISFRSIVFVDDSSIEIKAVEDILPDVSTILFKRDMNYELFSCFNLHKSVNIVEVKSRIETYQTDKYREILKSKYEDYAEYIKELEIKMDIREAIPIEYSRISELTQRTNKCTNGRRYTVAEIKKRIVYDGVKLYSISVSDRFSDLGIVGAIEIEGTTLTLFSLSCRALGREIEKKMLNYISKEYKIDIIEYHDTGKNKDMIALFYENFPNATVTI